MGNHGTKIIIYNLWHDGMGKTELDFESDEKVNIFIFLKLKSVAFYIAMFEHMSKYVIVPLSCFYLYNKSSSMHL